MKSRLILFLSILILSLNISKAQGIAATLDFCNFKANDTLGLFEYYLSFPANNLVHRENSEGLKASKVKVSITVLKNMDTVYYDGFQMNSAPANPENMQYEEYLIQDKIILPNGEYKVFLVAEDLNSNELSELKTDFPVKVGFDSEFIQMSDVQNLKSYRKVDTDAPNVKNGLEMISRNSNFFAKKDDKYVFYTEVYNADEILGQDQTYLLEGRIQDAKTGKIYSETGIFKKVTSAPVSPILAEIDLSPIPSGNYNLILELKDKMNQSLYTKSKFFQRYHPELEDPNLVAEVEEEPDLENAQFDKCQIADQIDDRNLTFLLNGLMPLAKQNERAFSEAVANSGDREQKINYLCYFFEKRETKDKDAHTLFMEYKERLEIAEKKYSTQTMPGYQTDRGRVYIQYGKPNRIDDEFTDMSRRAMNNNLIPYEIWLYYTVSEPQPQSNVTFVFAQKNRANNNYEIIHSTAIGEFNNPNWKSEVESRMMFQEDPTNQNFR